MEVGVPERYFNDTNFFFKTLRLLNLMEPGRAVISLSKLFFLLMMFTMVWITVNSPEHIVALLGAIGTTGLALLNYMWRRQQQVNTGVGISEIVPVADPDNNPGFSSPETTDEPVIDIT